MPRLFLLSPAKVDGLRAKHLLNPRASFELARRFQSEGATIAELFAYASSLYFRGKIAYARRFAAVGDGDVIRVITANAGLAPPERMLTPADLTTFGTVDIREDDPRYHTPLRRDAKALARKIGVGGEAILFGSIATGKYRDVLLEVFGDRLLFPAEFVGRGDMSRGGLLLRAARAGEELRYVAVRGAVLKGARPPKLGTYPPARLPPGREGRG